MPRAALLLASPLAFLLAACTQFPELGDTIAPAEETADYLPLVSFDRLQGPPAAEDDPAAAAEARSAALRARADRLRGAVIDPPTRSRMERGVPRR